MEELKKKIAELDDLWRRQAAIIRVDSSEGFLVELLEFRRELELPELWGDNE